MTTTDIPVPSLVDFTASPTADLWAIALGPRLGRSVALRDHSVRTLAAKSVGELVASYGFAPAKAQKVSAILELARRLGEEKLVRGAPFRGSTDIFHHFGPGMRDLRVEQFWVVFVDGKHRNIGQHMISQGTLTSSPVHPREVFGRAIRDSAAAIVLVHNHPSGDPSPSADDLEITRRLCSVGDLVGIRVLDHVIVGDGSFTSLADRGLMG